MQLKFSPLARGKMVFIMPLLIVLIASSGFIADDSCKNFYPMEEGKKFELTHYNAKDKEESRVEYEVIEKKESGNTASAIIRMKGYDKKGKSTFDGDFKVYCEDGIFKVDIRSMLSAAQLEQIESMQEMEVSFETNDLEMPSDMDVGDQLNDGNINISVTTADGGMTIMNMNTNIKDRKVVAKEKITTPAGSFDCIAITSVIESKTGFINLTYETKEWISENVGLVRSETYRKGNLEGYTLLTKFQ